MGFLFIYFFIYLIFGLVNATEHKNCLQNFAIAKNNEPTSSVIVDIKNFLLKYQ